MEEQSDVQVSRRSQRFDVLISPPVEAPLECLSVCFLPPPD